MRSKAIALPVANAVACVLFVVLREPVAADHRAELDDVHRRGGMVVNSGISGMLACRNIYPWSDWHGGGALGVKILEVANLPALIVTVAGHVPGTVVGVTRLVSACQWSWILAGGFLAVASAQWWLVGLLLDRLRDRLEGVAGVL